MNTEKIIKLEGAANFRDIGGYKTKSGGNVKTGLLYRSDELSQLTDNDLIILEHLGIKLICDLRTPAERKSKPDRIITNRVKNVNIPMNPLSSDFNQRKLFILMHKNVNRIDFDHLMQNYYQRFAFECNQQINEIITILSDQNNLPAVIHCTAGKDRTGFITAIIQLLAGVNREIVIKDYLETNKNIQQRTRKVIRFLRIMSLFRISENRLKPMLEVNAKYLEEVLDNIYVKYTSIQEYLTDACLVDNAIVIKLQNMLVEQ